MFNKNVYNDDYFCNNCGCPVTDIEYCTDCEKCECMCECE